MTTYLLRMFEKNETKGRTMFCRSHIFKVRLDENLDNFSKQQLAKKQHPNLIFQDYVLLKHKMPIGWKKLKGALTAPDGYFWASNKKSF